MDALTYDKYEKERININGCKLFSKYYINGSPTVLFEAGMGDSCEIWNSIQNQISLLTSTFCYDRAGVGSSDNPSVIPRTCLDVVEDLSKLLTKASVKAPFVLVGHSFGGLVVRLFASIYPNLTAGIILVDACPEYKEMAFEKVLPGKLIISNRQYYSNPMLNLEKIDKIKSYRQVKNHKYVFKFPLTIITRGLPDDYDEAWPNQEILDVEQKLQSKFGKLANDSKIIIAQQSRHYIQIDEPMIIIEAIKEMINKCRGESVRQIGDFT